MSTSRYPVRARARIGALGAGRGTVAEADRRKVIQARLPAGDWPARLLKVTAVDARTGEFVVFDPRRASTWSTRWAPVARCRVCGPRSPSATAGTSTAACGHRSTPTSPPGTRGRLSWHPWPRASGPSCPVPAWRLARWPQQEPVSRSCGRTARPCGPSAATCLTSRAGQRRRRPAGPRQRPKRPRSGQTGRLMASRPPPSRQASSRHRRPRRRAALVVRQHQPATCPAAGDPAAHPRSRAAALDRCPAPAASTRPIRRSERRPGC